MTNIDYCTVFLPQGGSAAATWHDIERLWSKQFWKIWYSTISAYIFVLDEWKHRNITANWLSGRAAVVVQVCALYATTNRQLDPDTETICTINYLPWYDEENTPSLQVATAANIWETACQGSTGVKRCDWIEVTGWADVRLTDSKSERAPD